MRKYLWAAFIAVVCLCPGASAQTLFTVGGEPVSAASFLAAYNRNAGSVKGTAPDRKAYLDLFIASRLKIKEARNLGLDTLPQMIADLQGLRDQILPTFLEDAPFRDSLVKEAFVRSRKDIQLHHIFIPVGKDSIAAKARVREAYDKLVKGAPFAAIARQYSDDPAAKTNGGAIGFITVFSLPYALENLIYATPRDKLAPVHQSASGYHILKNAGERKAAGRVRAAQILFAFPPEAGAAARTATKKTADSVYALLQSGGDFGVLATRFSNDVISAASNGQLPEFGIGEYDPVFETAVYSLPKNDVTSKPFETAHGWHIVKRLSFVPPPASLDKNTKAFLEERVEQSDRAQMIPAAFLKKIYAQAPLSKLLMAEDALWKATDSALRVPPGGTASAPTIDWKLLQFGSQAITFKDWLDHARAHQVSPGGTPKAYPQLFWSEYIPLTAIEYYKAHLEDFSPKFREQLDGFREGSLFFEIMQQHVWGPAQNDTAALKNYYRQHQKKYVWKSSADAVIFYAGDAVTADALHAEIIRAPKDWKRHVATFGEKVVADSNRFEVDVIPNHGKGALRNGSVTQPVRNASDNTASYALILRLYPKEEQRSFDAAKGLVIADYGEALDRAWIVELKKKYPVKLNETVWNALLKKPL